MTNLSTLPGFGASSGGGGGSSTDYPTLATLNDSMILTCGASTRVPYGYTSGHFAGQAPSGIIKNRETFGFWAQWRDQYNGYTGFTISSYKVDKSTGQISQLGGGHQDIWTNSSGAHLSTTYLTYDPIHGCFFSAGNNAFPGYNSHQQGYTKGQLKSDGSIGAGGYSVSGGDHGFNGTTCGALPQGTGTNYFFSAGYTGSYAGYRVNQADATGLNLGSFTNNGTWTSSSEMFNHIYQPDVNDTPSGEVTSMTGTSFNNPSYGWNILRDNNHSTQQNIPGGSQRGTVFCGYNATSVIQQSNNYFGTLGNGSNSWTTLKDGTRDLGSHTDCNSYVQDIVGIGNNRFLFFNLSGFDKGKHVDLIDFDSSNNPRHIKRFKFGAAGEDSVLDGSDGYSNYFVVYENNNDTYPKWIVQGTTESSYASKVNVYEITADISSYNSHLDLFFNPIA